MNADGALQRPNEWKEQFATNITLRITKGAIVSRSPFRVVRKALHEAFNHGWTLLTVARSFRNPSQVLLAVPLIT